MRILVFLFVVAIISCNSIEENKEFEHQISKEDSIYRENKRFKESVIKEIEVVEVKERCNSKQVFYIFKSSTKNRDTLTRIVEMYINQVFYLIEKKDCGAITSTSAGVYFYNNKKDYRIGRWEFMALQNGFSPPQIFFNDFTY